MNEDARLVIIRELVQQDSGSLNETLLTHVLDSFGHKHNREWVQERMNELHEFGAVVTSGEAVLIATITRAGRDHVERRTVIKGIAKPSPEV